MHKGVMMETLTVRGRAGHSSDPSLGANAIDGMHAVLGEVLAFRAELKARHRHPGFKVDCRADQSAQGFRQPTDYRCATARAVDRLSER